MPDQGFIEAQHGLGTVGMIPDAIYPDMVSAYLALCCSPPQICCWLDQATDRHPYELCEIQI